MTRNERIGEGALLKQTLSMSRLATAADPIDFQARLVSGGLTKRSVRRH
jgi:hypothetical protein